MQRPAIAATGRRRKPASAAGGPRRDPAPRGGAVVRPARAGDLPEIIAIDEEITGIPKVDYWHVVLRSSKRTQNRQYVLVATTEDPAHHIAGFILGEIRAWEFGSAPCGWVIGLSVRPNARLQGIGQSLLDALVARFRAAEVTKMRTMVARSNQLHHLFFRSAGMTAGPYIELEKELG